MAPGGLVEVRVSWPRHPRYLKKKKEKRIRYNNWILEIFYISLLLVSHPKTHSKGVTVISYFKPEGL